MSLFLDNMTIVDGAFDAGDVEVNFFKDDETNKMKCIEFTNRRFNQNISIKYEEIDNLIAMLQLVKKKKVSSFDSKRISLHNPAKLL